jgi:hypothetical protein
MTTIKRKDALAAVRAAGWHGDGKAGLMAWVSARMSHATYAREYLAGSVARENGEPCQCATCQATSFSAPETTPQGVQAA